MRSNPHERGIQDVIVRGRPKDVRRPVTAEQQEAGCFVDGNRLYASPQHCPAKCENRRYNRPLTKGVMPLGAYVLAKMLTAMLLQPARINQNQQVMGATRHDSNVRPLPSEDSAR